MKPNWSRRFPDLCGFTPLWGVQAIYPAAKLSQTTPFPWKFLYSIAREEVVPPPKHNP